MLPTASEPVPAVTIVGRATFYSANAGDSAGAIVAGDFNGDGIKDLLLAAAASDGPEGARPDAGQAYLFLGPFDPGEERDAAQGRFDAVVHGADAGDQLGRAVAAGDFNGDGIDDIFLAAPFADGPQDSRPKAGEVYIVLGSRRLGDTVREMDIARDQQDATIFGADADDLLGFALQAADVNGDSRADLIIGAFWADGPANDRPNAGEAYVVYGGEPRQADLAAGQQDVTVYGAEAEDRLGETVGAGDVDGDGQADLILTAAFADGPNNSRPEAGETYIVFAPPQPMVDIADGQQDVTVLGIDPGDQVGHSSAAADVNGDGLADILLGVVSADGPANQSDLAGEAYLLDGSDRPPSVIDMAADPPLALIYGAEPGDRLGRSAAMGDVNGDGLSDLLIAAPNAAAQQGAKPRAGAVYVFYGRRHRQAQVQTTADADLTLAGLDAEDILAHEAFGTPPLLAADMDGDGLAEILVAAPRTDGPENNREDAGEAYIIFLSR
jgi:hypothetical protein